MLCEKEANIEMKTARSYPYRIVFLSVIFTVFCVNGCGPDSQEVWDKLEEDPEYPFIGFWKSDCKDPFGLLIMKASEGKYSISFCGPGGSYFPGTYRPNSDLVSDPNYKIIDKNTIEVKGKEGFSRYYRCGKDLKKIK